MREKVVSSDRCNGSACDACAEPQITGCRDKEHRHIGHEKDQRTSQVLREHQDQNMDRRNNGRLNDRVPVCRLVEHGSHKEYKADLYKLGWLHRKSPERQGELGSVGSISDHAHHSEEHKPQDPVDPRKRDKLPHPVDDERDDPCHDCCRRNDRKLTHRPVGIQSCQDNKSRCQERAHIVDEKPGAVPVKQAGQIDIQQEKQHLRPIKGQHRHRSRIQPDQDIRQKVKHKQAHELTPADAVFSLLIPHGKETEIIVSIQGNEEDHQVSRYLYDQIRQKLSPTLLRA